MEKNLFRNRPGKIIFLAACMLLVVNACKKEVANIFNDKEQVRADVQWAKEYYLKNLLPKEKGFMSLQGQKLMNIKPGDKERIKQVFLNWNTATAEEQANFDFVEVPLKSNFVSKSVFNMSASRQVNAAVDERTLNASFDRLMIFKNEDGVISERIVSYVPDKAYSDRHTGNITHNTIDKLDKDFFGYLQYKDWQGNTEFILRIENGVTVKKFSGMQPVSLPTMGSAVNAQGLMLVDSGGGGGGGCLVVTQSHTERWCYYDNWYDDNPRYCDPWETIIDGEYLWCPGAPNPGGGGGGGGVPTPDPEPEPDKPDPCKGAKSVSDNWAYNGEMSFLAGKLNMDRETGFIKYANQSSNQITAPTAGLFLPIPEPQDITDHTLDYINHTHFKDAANLALSTMDWDDFQAYCVYLGLNKATDNNKFTLGVTTGYGSYSFILGDQAKFNTFFTTTFGPNSDMSGTGAYNTMWAKFFNESTGITKTNNGLVNEKHLIDLLKDTGVSLLKKNADGTWSAITKDSNGNVVKVHCNTGGAVE